MSSPPRLRAAIGFILVTLTLDVLSMTLVIPVLPPLVQRFTHGSAPEAARAIGLFATGWALMQFIFSPVQGALSDRFGRRPVILMSNLGLGLDYILMALAPNLSWLFVGRLISGITAASFSCSTAYIADISPPNRRAARFGLMSVAVGLSFVCGPVLGALLGKSDPRLPFRVAAALSLLNFAWGLLVLPESLPRSRRGIWSWRRASPIGPLYLLRDRRGLGRLASVLLQIQISHNVLPTMLVLYVTNRYGFTYDQLAWTLGTMGVCNALVGGWLTGRVVRAVGEFRTLLAGLAAGTVGTAIIGLAPDGDTFFLSIPFLSLTGLVSPALNALMSRRVLSSEQGRLQGMNSSMLGIAGLVGPSLYTGTYAYFAAPHAGWHVPGMPFLIAGGLMASASITAWLAVHRRRPLPMPAASD